MRFRTLTGAQRHRLTNMLFVAGVVSAIGTVTGSNILGCPAVNRDARLDHQKEDINTDDKGVHRQKEQEQQRSSLSDALKGLQETWFSGGQIREPSQPSKGDSIDYKN